MAECSAMKRYGVIDRVENRPATAERICQFDRLPATSDGDRHAFSVRVPVLSEQITVTDPRFPQRAVCG